MVKFTKFRRVEIQEWNRVDDPQNLIKAFDNAQERPEYHQAVATMSINEDALNIDGLAKPVWLVMPADYPDRANRISMVVLL